jgi:hypothetical protein
MSMLKSGGIRSLHPFVLVLAMAIMCFVGFFQARPRGAGDRHHAGQSGAAADCDSGLHLGNGRWEIAVQMSQVISNNLNRSGLFPHA